MVSHSLTHPSTYHPINIMLSFEEDIMCAWIWMQQFSVKDRHLFFQPNLLRTSIFNSEYFSFVINIWDLSQNVILPFLLWMLKLFFNTEVRIYIDLFSQTVCPEDQGTMVLRKVGNCLPA
jgi:hypothetical protein